MIEAKEQNLGEDESEKKEEESEKKDKEKEDNNLGEVNLEIRPANSNK